MEQMNNAAGEVPSSPLSSDNTPAPQAPEKTFTERQVNDIVKARLQRAQAPEPTQSVDLEEVRRVAAEAAREAAQQEHESAQKKQVNEFYQREGARVQNEFASKMNAVKEKYADFDTTVSGFPFTSFPNSLIVSNGFDNTGDIMMELVKNPTKLEQLESLAARDPSMTLIKREMQRISDSIKINEKATSAKTANAPLSQITPSSIGADNGSPTLNDLKRIYRG